MIAVLISNAIAALLEKSLYDSIIVIKKLPYLPDLLPSSSGMYNIFVEHFMVRDVKFIWQSISYTALKNVLKKNKHLRSLPVVDNPENMILLGSVQRHELIKMIDKQIGREKRLEVAAKWHKEAEQRAREQLEKMQKEVEEAAKSRRPSRFEVVPAQSLARLRELANNEMASPQAKQLSGSFPRKSILKKTNSFNLRHFSPLPSTSPSSTPYSTITAAESRLRSAFDVIFRKSATLPDAPGQKSSIEDTEHDSGDNAEEIIPPVSLPPTSPPTPLDTISFSPNVSKKVQLVRHCRTG